MVDEVTFMEYIKSIRAKRGYMNLFIKGRYNGYFRYL